MPTVTLKYSDGHTSRDSGGCFGFTGRHSSLRRARTTITEYEYDLGVAIRDAYQNLAETQRRDVNPVPMIEWLASSSSPWCKYVAELKMSDTFKGSKGQRGTCSVVMKTDVVGHAVVGTASIFRFVSYLMRVSRHSLNVFNASVDLGAKPSISFLMAALAYRRGGSMLSNNPSASSNLCGRPDLRDDTPFALDQLDLSTLMSLVDCTFEYKVDDVDSELYSNTGRYSQQILNSFSVGRFNLAEYIKNRFFNTSGCFITKVQTASRSGMGTRRSTATGFRVDAEFVIEPLALVGVALQLTAEYKSKGTFSLLNPLN